MPISHRSRGAVVLVAFVAACSGIADPGVAQPSVVVQRDTIVATIATGFVDWMHFTVPVAIRNPTATALSFNYCSFGIEARSDDTWRAVWSPSCAFAANSPTDIQPGETRTLTLSIDAAVRGPGGPTWDNASVNGAYRLSAALVPSGVRGDVPTVPSNTFTLVRAN